MGLRVLVFGEQGSTVPPGLPETQSGADYVITSDVEVMRAALPGIEVVFQYGTPKDALERAWTTAADVRWVHVGGVGVDLVLFDRLVASDVVVTNSRGVFDVAMPEYVLSLMLALVNELPATMAAQTQRIWHHRWLETLSWGRVLILGAGSIARATALMLRSMGMTVTLVGRRARADGADEPVHAMSELASLLPEADWLIGLLPLTPTTRGSIGREQLELLATDADREHRPGTDLRRSRPGRCAGTWRRSSRGAGRLRGRAADRAQSAVDDAERHRVAARRRRRGRDGACLDRRILANLEQYMAGEALCDVVDKRLGYVISER